jgi:hypothetical protein
MIVKGLLRIAYSSRQDTTCVPLVTAVFNQDS